MTSLVVLDSVCDQFALEGQFAPELQVRHLPSDPFLRWVAELGIRDGQWLRDKQREMENRGA
jgi:hypothetical protein